MQLLVRHRRALVTQSTRGIGYTGHFVLQHFTLPVLIGA